MQLVKQNLSDEDSPFWIRKTLMQHFFLVMSLSKDVSSLEDKMKIIKSIKAGKKEN